MEPRQICLVAGRAGEPLDALTGSFQAHTVAILVTASRARRSLAAVETLKTSITDALSQVATAVIITVVETVERLNFLTGRAGVSWVAVALVEDTSTFTATVVGATAGDGALTHQFAVGAVVGS